MNQNKRTKNYSFYVALVAGLAIIAVLVGVYTVRNQENKSNQYVDLNDNGSVVSEKGEDVSSVGADVKKAKNSDKVVNADSTDPEKIGTSDLAKANESAGEVAMAEPNPKGPTSESTQMSTQIQDTSDNPQNVNKKEEEKKKAQEASEEKTQDVVNVSESKAFTKKDKLTWPVQGNVILPYSMDTTIYFETLDAYKTNNGMVIESAEGTPVYAPFSGTVEKVDASDEYGNMVTLELGGGYTLTLGQLKDIKVAQGDSFKQGDAIATIAKTTSLYSTEGDNLYISMQKDGEYIDPSTFLQ